MKCDLKNTCGRRDYCCNFCTIKCPVRCKDDHTNCQWFVNEPIEDETLIDNKAVSETRKGGKRNAEINKGVQKCTVDRAKTHAQ